MGLLMLLPVNNMVRNCGNTYPIRYLYIVFPFNDILYLYSTPYIIKNIPHSILFVLTAVEGTLQRFSTFLSLNLEKTWMGSNRPRHVASLPTYYCFQRDKTLKTVRTVDKILESYKLFELQSINQSINQSNCICIAHIHKPQFVS